MAAELKKKKRKRKTFHVAGNSKIDHPEKENQLSKHVINVFTAKLLNHTVAKSINLYFPFWRLGKSEDPTDAAMLAERAALSSYKPLEPLGHLAKSTNIILAPLGGHEPHSVDLVCLSPYQRKTENSFLDCHFISSSENKSSKPNSGSWSNQNWISGLPSDPQIYTRIETFRMFTGWSLIHSCSGIKVWVSSKKGVHCSGSCLRVRFSRQRTLNRNGRSDSVSCKGLDVTYPWPGKIPQFWCRSTWKAETAQHLTVN